MGCFGRIYWILLCLSSQSWTVFGFVFLSPPSDHSSLHSAKTKEQEITNLADLDACWTEFGNDEKEVGVAASLSVRGDTQIIGSPDHTEFVHPVVRILHERKRKQASGGDRNKDKEEQQQQKIALVIEGGGMRGCVTAGKWMLQRHLFCVLIEYEFSRPFLSPSCVYVCVRVCVCVCKGMVCAIDYCGLRDCVDVVYGSSAGSIIGAYFITGQLPWFGPEVYYDQLTTAGKSFIDTGRLLRALGLGLLNPKLIKDVITRRNAGKPILDLDFLLKDTMQERKPLDWTTFVQRQNQQIQPLKVVASGLKSEKPIVLSYEDGHFTSLEELAKCMHASSLLPGLAGKTTPSLKMYINPSTFIY